MNVHRIRWAIFRAIALGGLSLIPPAAVGQPPRGLPRISPTAPNSSPSAPSAPLAAPLLLPHTVEQGSPVTAAGNTMAANGLAQALADVISDAIPRAYEKRKDWGRTKRVTTGLRSDGNFFEFKIHRRKKEVNHGTWKHYRITMIDPEEHLAVRVDNLRSLEAGRIGLTLFFTARLDGWAKTRVYNRGLHLITLTAEGDTTVRLQVDCEVALAWTPSVFFSGISFQPHVIDARVEFDDFRLRRVSKAKGALVQELGRGLRHLIEDELQGPDFVAKLNRAIAKKQDRLQLSAADWLTLESWGPQTGAPAGSLGGPGTAGGAASAKSAWPE